MKKKKDGKLKKILLSTVMQRIYFFIFIIVAWQVMAKYSGINNSICPTGGQIWDALVEGFTGDMELLDSTLYTLRIILEGVGIGLLLAVLLTALSVTSGFFRSFIDSLTALAHPMPGIALLPIIIAWVGLGEGPVIFIIIHAILWPMLLSCITGFSSVPKMYKDFGMNIGLGRAKIVTGIYIPASLPNLISGLKIGWARAWRALISAEMLVGASSTKYGLGQFIMMKKSYCNYASVIASIVVIVVIGILVEDILFKQIEKRTIRKWGMIS